MILIDYNQMCIAAIMVMVTNPKKLDEDITRHVTLNTLRSYKTKYGKEYGNIIICADNRNYWRRQFFPYYKAMRKVNREKSKYDWHVIFTALNKILVEIQTHLPYKVINIDSAEADDIIGTLAPRYAVNEKVLIISSDKDFLQLQKYPNIKQFSPNLNRLITTDNPYNFLKEHILKGESGDGIPNYLSADDVFVTGTRQKPLSKKKLNVLLDSNLDNVLNTLEMTRYKRNQTLIDLSFIPINLQNQIIEESRIPPKEFSYSGMMKYFMDNNLKNLFDVITDFK
jgi:hypothetical protein